ncbi:stress response translation initiation inhibitor YciH [Saccharobesus litoralis]|uniref:Stress response translation initiation inhibitor YciH n=1 Tax=Saccharobesus litoralis TaxID=2172099 RepID=A0A2S0VRZ3_9ALTE|nr:stress response translation initiation inhibitor YciH [Saccharobesus litoralis]AWB66974.1 stress response translation initiation inhibitor YciH [Saccharobesus litoralis]
MSDSNLVYSTGLGRIKQEKSAPQAQIFDDGFVRVRRETKGRKGKGVITITGVPLTGTELKTLAQKLKKKCGTGGSIKDGVIEIQGDKRDVIKAELEANGYKVKFSGG